MSFGAVEPPARKLGRPRRTQPAVWVRCVVPESHSAYLYVSGMSQPQINRTILELAAVGALALRYGMVPLSALPSGTVLAETTSALSSGQAPSPSRIDSAMLDGAMGELMSLGTSL